MKPVLGASSSSFSQMLVARPRESTLVHRLQQVNLQPYKQLQTSPSRRDLSPDPAKLTGRSPTLVEGRNRGLTDSRSNPQMSRSLSNVILPPPLEPPTRSFFESPGRSPYEVSYRENDELQFEEFPTSSMFNLWQLNFRTQGCSVSYHLI